MNILKTVFSSLSSISIKVPGTVDPNIDVPSTSSEKVLKLSQTTATLKVGETLQLKATVDGKEVEPTYSYTGSVATVDKNGKVTAKEAGTTDINARYTYKDGLKTVTLKSTCKVTVSAKSGQPSSGGGSSTTKITTSSVVKTDAANALPILSKEELLYAIENASVTSTGKRRENLKAQIDNFMYIQNNNKVNALFAIAVAIEESSAGQSEKATSINNWFGITKSDGSFREFDNGGESIQAFGKLISGSTYFGSGKITPGAIGPVYCPNKPEWGATITSHMNSLYKTLNK